PMLEILVAQEQVFHHRLGGGVGLPLSQLEGEQGVASRVHLAALTLSLAVVVVILFEKGSDEFPLLFQVLIMDRKAAFPSRCESQDRDRLVMASEASLLGNVTFRSLRQQWQGFANCCLNFVGSCSCRHGRRIGGGTQR